MSARIHIALHSSPRPPSRSGGSGLAIARFILGLLALLAWCIPLFGLPITVVGLVLSIKGRKSGYSGLAIAGIVLNAIGLALTLVNGALGAYLAAIGQHGLVNQFKKCDGLCNAVTCTLQGPEAEAVYTPEPTRGVALADAPPQVRFRQKAEGDWYATKANAVVVRHVSGHRVVAVVEVVSPVNKTAAIPYECFLTKRSRCSAPARICSSSICFRQARAILCGFSRLWPPRA